MVPVMSSGIKAEEGLGEERKGQVQVDKEDAEEQTILLTFLHSSDLCRLVVWLT